LQQPASSAGLRREAFPPDGVTRLANPGIGVGATARQACWQGETGFMQEVIRMLEKRSAEA